MGESQGLLRLSHFHGLRLEAKDFEDGERYHIEKRKIHNRQLHRHGVVSGYEGGLRCSARGRGDMTVEVAPGYAVDGEGNDVFLDKVTVKTIDPDKFKLPATIYVCLKHVDEPTEFVVNPANPKYKGHARILETSTIEITAKEPDPRDSLELARVYLEEGITELKEPVDRNSPQPGEVDRRYVARAGVAGSFIDPRLLNDLVVCLRESRKTFGKIAYELNLLTARDARQTIIAMEMMGRGNVYNFLSDAYHAMRILVEIEAELIHEVRKVYPLLAQGTRYQDYAENIQGLVAQLREAKMTDEEFLDIISYQRRAMTEVQGMIDEAKELGVDPVAMGGGGSPKAEASSSQEEEAAPSDDVVEDEVIEEDAAAEPEPELDETPDPDAEVLSTEQLNERSEMPEKIFLEEAKKNFSLVDQVTVADPGSEKEHGFSLGGKGISDKWRKREKLEFPDGNKLTVKGRGYKGKGAYSQFTMQGLTPGKDVLIVKRMDYQFGDVTTGVAVEGTKVGKWEVSGSDRKIRGRNASFRVPGESITGSTATVRQVSLDDNMVTLYGLFFYQATR